MYLDNEKQDFRWEACWNAVKGTSKWLNHVEVQRGKKKKPASKRRSDMDIEVEQVFESPLEHGSSTPSTTGTPSSSTREATPGAQTDDSSSLERPLGRKAAKKARSRSSSAGEDLFAEHFKEMQVENRGYYDQVEAKRAAEAVAARKEMGAFRAAEAERKLRFKAQELEERRR